MSELIVGRKIWDESCAPQPPLGRLESSSLIRFEGHWYCAFREAPMHNSHPAARSRVIRSADGAQWHTVLLLDWDTADVRDVHLSITGEGCLMLTAAAQFVSPLPRHPEHELAQKQAMSYTPPDARKQGDHPASYYRLDWLGTTLNLPDHDDEQAAALQSVTWFSRDGSQWSAANACPTGVNSWRWKTTWHEGMGYSFAQWGKDAQGCLYRTRDGRNWRKIADHLFPQGHAGEASIAFENPSPPGHHARSNDGKAWALLRGDNHAKVFLGESKGPGFARWKWSPLRVDWHGDGSLQKAEDVFGVGIGGPELLRLGDGRLVAAGRVLGPQRDDGRVTLFLVDPVGCVLSRFATFDGTGYPGIVEHDSRLWVTYVSSACHQDRWEIHMASIPLPGA